MKHKLLWIPVAGVVLLLSGLLISQTAIGQSDSAGIVVSDADAIYTPEPGVLSGEHLKAPALPSLISLFGTHRIANFFLNGSDISARPAITTQWRIVLSNMHRIETIKLSDQILQRPASGVPERIVVDGAEHIQIAHRLENQLAQRPVNNVQARIVVFGAEHIKASGVQRPTFVKIPPTPTTAATTPPTDTPIPSTTTPIPTATLIPTATNSDTPPPTLVPTKTDMPTPTPTPTDTLVPTVTNANVSTPALIPTVTATTVPQTFTPSPSVTSVPPTLVPTEAASPVPATITPTPPVGDGYESDDLCSQANVLPVDGERQDRTFHQEGDEDWVKMKLLADIPYELSAISTSARADLSIELYLACDDSIPEDSDSPTGLGAGAVVEIEPSRNGTYYAKIVSQESDIYGSDVTYGLELKALAQQEDLAIIIMGRNDGYTLQNNIFRATNTAYRAFRNGGIPKGRIRYLGLLDDERGDADRDEISDVDTAATTANIQDVITNWAVERVGNESRVYIYLMDHGLVDQMMIDGSDDLLTPDMLDQWLGALEAETGADVAVIYEACLSGSFITGSENIGRTGRIVITSTTDDANAYPRKFGGALFSDSFFAALNRGETLYEAYQQGRKASITVMENQRPMLDDNGDRQSNSEDGDLARQWILKTNEVLGSDDETIVPVLAEPQMPESINNGEGMIRVAISNSEKIKQVWVEVRPPDYTEPATVTDGIMPESDLPIVSLSDSDGDGTYIGVYEGFVEEGVYRFIAYAENEDGDMLLPSSTESEITLSPVELSVKRIYLPLISR